jgi:CheY-like chemotaxis protein
MFLFSHGCVIMRAMRVLFVDDLVDTRELYSMALRLEGFDVRAAESGHDALMAISQAQLPFHIAVIDVEMPGMSGWELLRAIRSMPRGKYFPVVMYSAYGEMRERAREEGANHILTKPIMPHEMIDSIRLVIKEAWEQVR